MLGFRAVEDGMGRGSVCRLAVALAIPAALVAACHGSESRPNDGAVVEAGPPAAASVRALPPAQQGALDRQRLTNVVAYIPPQCFTKTRPVGAEAAKNPCYVCHVDAPPPNFAMDGNLQVTLALPVAAADDPWKNLFAPPFTTHPRAPDDDVLGYVRQDNYFDADGNPALAEVLKAPPSAWDLDGNGAWSGYKPDVWFRFDAKGFDHKPDGTPTGWRAFAYYPFPGTFFPTNGSTDDVLIRLDAHLQEDKDGHYDPRVYETNLAVVEALIEGRDVPIEPTDEAAMGVDLDLDGRLGRATRVAFDAAPDAKGGTRMRYAGAASDPKGPGHFAIAPGLFPAGTEFFHTVRYLDVDAAGEVTMARRMKELRYARKAAFFPYESLRGRAAADAREVARSRDGSRHVNWQGERGIDNGQGWMFQGFIEDKSGALRPQSREESVFCAGCHGGIGATSDSIFSFPRKLGGKALDRGWFYWSKHGLRGLPEPKRGDGSYEYTVYLQQAGAGDELRENTEVIQRFFDAQGRLRPEELARLHGDIGRLLLPSAPRALDLDRAYRAIVDEQGFALGRDAVLARSDHVYEAAPVGGPTGVRVAVPASHLVE
jgi:hypothetical protein